MFKDFPICISFGSHYGRTYLAESDSMSPSRTMQNDFIAGDLNLEGGAFQMAFRKYSPDFQFLAYDKGVFGTGDTKLAYPA